MTDPKVSREDETDRFSENMKDRKRVATRYAVKAQSKEHQETLKELLELLDAPIPEREDDNSTDLENFDFNL